MFCGSIKKNIDPLEENDNESIIKVLKDTGLYDTILKLPEDRIRNYVQGMIASQLGAQGITLNAAQSSPAQLDALRRQPLFGECPEAAQTLRSLLPASPVSTPWFHR